MHRFWKILFPLLSAFLLCAAAGCASADPAPSQEDPAGPETTVFDCGGMQAGIPTQYLDLLLIETNSPEAAANGGWLPLLHVREKASVEAAEANWGDGDGFGFLFSINALDQAAFERHLCADGSGVSIFAKGGDRYYAKVYPTDVQFYRSDGTIDTESEDWKQWEILCDLGEQVCGDFITRNGLTPYDESSFWEREFTYDGNHAYVNYYPYFTFDGDKRIWDTLVLSQPARQGEGGIWCVERYYDASGNVYPWFPDSGMAAADYYAELQAACDAGRQPELLTPLGAAKHFEEQEYGLRETLPKSFSPADGVDFAYIETNQRINRLLSSLYFDREVDSLELLDCMGVFTPDNWGVLGRSHYGSDWWTPLRAALEEAAVGQGQETRNRDMMRLYLSSHGQFEEAIAGFLQAQQNADPAVFDAVLSEFSQADQARLQAALMPANT